MGRSASLGLASTFQQTTSAGKAGIVVRIVVVKVFGFQSATETFLKAGDAKTATLRLQARSLPYAVSDGVDFGVAIDCLLNATPIRPSADRPPRVRRVQSQALSAEPSVTLRPSPLP